MNWTKEQEQALIRCYPECTMEELVILLDMPAHAIRNKAAKLKLKKNEDLLMHIKSQQGKRNAKHLHTGTAKERMKQSIRNMVRLEKLRIKYNLPRKTRKILTLMSPRECRQKARRLYYLRLKGYETDCNSNIIYYSNETKRSTKTEKTYTKLGYIFQQKNE